MGLPCAQRETKGRPFSLRSALLCAGLQRSVQHRFALFWRLIQGGRENGDEPFRDDSIITLFTFHELASGHLCGRLVDVQRLEQRESLLQRIRIQYGLAGDADTGIGCQILKQRADLCFIR